MRFWFKPAPDREESTEDRRRLAGLQQGLVAARIEAEGLRDLVRHLDSDRALLLGALTKIRPAQSRHQMAETMHDLVFRPFNLASFYVAEIDWALDELSFLYYHEGGRPRENPSRRLSVNPGLTGRALIMGKPLYTRTLEEAQAMGAILTEAEKNSGLIPASWFGVPLGFGGKPRGLVSYQSFQPDAFPEARRQLLEALSGLLGLELYGGG